MVEETAAAVPAKDKTIASIMRLKECGGSSLQAIKKYLAVTYKVVCEKLTPFIKKFFCWLMEKGHQAKDKKLPRKQRQTKIKDASGQEIYRKQLRKIRWYQQRKLPHEGSSCQETSSVKIFHKVKK
jgi:hypothetical protein